MARLGSWGEREMTTTDVAGPAAEFLVMATGSDTVWTIARERFAALFDGSRLAPSTPAWLDVTYRTLHGTPLTQLKGVQAALAGEWTTRIVELLDERPATEAELTFLVTDLQALLSVPPGNPGQVPAAKQKRGLDFLRHTTPYLASGSLLLFTVGFIFIGFYVSSNGGKSLGNMAVGWLTACAAFAAGGLVGLVVGIPRFVSSGALRHDVETGNVPAMKADQAGPAQSNADQASQNGASSVAPSSNLAEISDWLTKLLLGAGLVELTRLGRPLGTLIDDVAAGLGSATSSGRVVAAAILITYVTLGFIDVYIVTTLWYGKHLQELGY
jgi:hypothetical protein